MFRAWNVGSMATLSRRADVCGGVNGLSQCGGSFPSSFCCGPSTFCYGYQSNKSVVCCPNGSDCTALAPTSCDVQLYNATTHPESPMHLTDLTQSAPPCGSGTCCPPGFTCDQNRACYLRNTTNTTSSANGAGVQSTAASSAGSSSTQSAITLTTAAVSSSTIPISVGTSCPLITPAAIVIGFFCGLVAGIALTALIFVCLRRRASRAPRPTPNNAAPMMKVSDPIPKDLDTTRTDFLRYASKSRRTPRSKGSPTGTTLNGSIGSGTLGMHSRPISRVRSLFSRTPTLNARKWERTDDGPKILDSPSTADMRDTSDPKFTPPSQIRREPSTESIKIYSPPETRADMAPYDRQTTFVDMLRSAGVVPPPPPPPMPTNPSSPAARPPVRPLYEGSPGLVDPRRRPV